MTSKSFSRSSADGFSLVELLVAMALMLTVGAAALSLISSGRNLFDLDRDRTRVNQGLKAGRDFLGLDVRQAGERLPSDFPALEIVRGEDLPGGAAGDPDRLVLRRNLVSTVMRSCRQVSGTNRKVYIAEYDNPPPPGCVPVPDDDGDSWPDNHKIWNDYRKANGTTLLNSKYVWAYIFNPVNKQGEFFRYWKDNKSKGFLRTPPAQSWTFSYPVSDQARVYLLEERRYQLDADTLQIVVNEVDSEAINIAGDIVDFQLLAHLDGQPPTDLLGPTDDWTDLRSIEFALESQGVFGDTPLERRLSTRLTPRNVMSR